MRFLIPLLALPLLALAGHPSQDPAQESAQAPTQETGLGGYDRELIRGWTVWVSQEFALDEALHDEVRELLDVKLYDVTRTVPVEILERLRDVRIFLEVEARDPCAVYHPSRRWLVEHDYLPEKARCVEIANARNFLAWSLDQPSMLVHELMHAYHHQHLGYDHAGIRAAYREAKASGAYESVLRYNAESQRAYALVDEKEYFAEICEAWFGVNDFYPFVRAELAHHDPQGHALLESLFGE